MASVYRVEVATRDALCDSEGRGVLHDFIDYGLVQTQQVRAVRVYSLAGELTPRQAERVAREFLTDPVVEMYTVNAPVLPAHVPSDTTIEIGRRPGVMDPAEASIRKGIRELGMAVDWVRTSKKYIVNGSLPKAEIETAALRILANALIEEVMIDQPLPPRPPQEQGYTFARQEVPLAGLNDEALLALSKRGQLHLSLAEMKTVQGHFAGLNRAPTDIELETLAQTWSEHCVHKTLRDRKSVV
jgi:phosphoribosylformylglycinamidine synthase